MDSLWLIFCFLIIFLFFFYDDISYFIQRVSDRIGRRH